MSQKNLKNRSDLFDKDSILEFDFKENYYIPVTPAQELADIMYGKGEDEIESYLSKIKATVTYILDGGEIDFEHMNYTQNDIPKVSKATINALVYDESTTSISGADSRDELFEEFSFKKLEFEGLLQAIGKKYPELKGRADFVISMIKDIDVKEVPDIPDAIEGDLALRSAETLER